MKKNIDISIIILAIYLIWYTLPVLRYHFSGVYNYIFMGLFVVGILIFVFTRKGGKFELNIALITVLMFCLCFSYFALIGNGNSTNSFKIVVSYWAPFVMFTQLENCKNGEERFCVRLALILILITLLTTLYNLVLDPSISRSLTASLTDEDLVGLYQSKNCGNIYLIQSSVLFVPVLVNNIVKKKYVIMSVFLIVLLVFLLVHASFTIALFVFLAILFISMIHMSKMDVALKFIIILSICYMLIFRINNILEFIRDNVNNTVITERVKSLISVLNDHNYNLERIELYQKSFNTFLRFPFGVGAFYFENYHGIGNHSQILDDLARYGVVAILFYVLFFVGYYRLLLKNWKMINSEKVVMPCFLAIIFFLMLNPGFRGNSESVVTLLILPGLPYVIKYKQTHK